MRNHADPFGLVDFSLEMPGSKSVRSTASNEPVRLPSTPNASRGSCTRLLSVDAPAAAARQVVVRPLIGSARRLFLAAVVAGLFSSCLAACATTAARHKAAPYQTVLAEAASRVRTMGSVRYMAHVHVLVPRSRGLSPGRQTLSSTGTIDFRSPVGLQIRLETSDRIRSGGHASTWDEFVRVGRRSATQAKGHGWKCQVLHALPVSSPGAVSFSSALLTFPPPAAVRNHGVWSLLRTKRAWQLQVRLSGASFRAVVGGKRGTAKEVINISRSAGLPISVAFHSQQRFETGLAVSSGSMGFNYSTSSARILLPRECS
jgi:hypothetical protein